jgi:type VI secretion system protein ImpM
MSASRAMLSDRWLDIYLTSPAWRIAAGPGACGPDAFVALMVPSVDRVGRYFPMTLVGQVPAAVSVLTMLRLAAPFFEAAERLAIETLASDPVDFTAFDTAVAALGGMLAFDPLPVVGEDAQWSLDDGSVGCHVPLAASADPTVVFEQLVVGRMLAGYAPAVAWCTTGSALVDPCCLITRGLPPSQAFVGLLDGGWRGAHWRSMPVTVPGPGTDATVADGPPMQFRSAAKTDPGPVRRVNQDAYLERADVGVWVVADGMGGHAQGEVASRMVCDALADLIPAAAFDDTVVAAIERIQGVNDQLHQASIRPTNAVRSGSTVVALLTRGAAGVVLWAGDSRAYVCRNGGLERLTRDHSLQSEHGSADAYTITRAVGGEATLLLDVARHPIRPGDRYLLCSDGLTRTVPEEQICRWLEGFEVGEAVDGLIRAALEAGAPDNVTAVVVEACT